MRIAFFTDTFFPEINGISTCVATLAEELARRGHQVMIVTYDWPSLSPVPWNPANITVLRVPSFCLLPNTPFRVTWRLRKLWREVKAFHPDIVHFHLPFTLGLFAIRYAKRTHTPLIGTLHTYLSRQNADVLRIAFKNSFFRAVLQKISLALNHWIYDRCDVRLAPSRLLIEELVSAHLSKDITFLPNPAPHRTTSNLPMSREALREKFHAREHVIVHVGRLSPEKNVDTLIRAFGEMQRQDTTLLIVGDGVARAALETVAKGEGVADRVVFTGFIEPDELIGSCLLTVGDVFATMSTMENQPMSVLEAMEAGLPIVGVRAAGLPELITDNGVLVAPGDTQAMAQALNHLLDDGETRRGMAERSKANAKRYSAKSICDRLLSVYDRVKTSRADAIETEPQSSSISPM